MPDRLPRGHILLDRTILAVTAGFAVVALVLLTWRGLSTTPRAAVAGIVYGLTLAASAVASLIYNTGFKTNKTSLWRFADHICIFLLIAGTYTPLSLMGPKDGVGFLLIPIWVMAAVGIGLKLYLRLKHERWFILFYLAMGWTVVFGLNQLVASFSTTVLTLVVIGGLAYSAGVIFYALDARWRWGGAVWHAAVLVGTATHFVAIFSFVLPVG
ncbi:MAG TPA: hemolysin III family protein [Aliidongia sp.]|uniref:PAQR family membrane homeostasis protein TrhA n=1 Tax=Aliidongia sp. TaxID=1914230 RepID=UPI002DDD0D7F|nr:hemolysin III family protein [Aliidongia sp.]HEV2675751.1 hemolysin III family protein [Aliidongia sp.]